MSQHADHVLHQVWLRTGSGWRLGRMPLVIVRNHQPKNSRWRVERLTAGSRSREHVDAWLARHQLTDAVFDTRRDAQRTLTALLHADPLPALISIRLVPAGPDRTWTVPGTSIMVTRSLGGTLLATVPGRGAPLAVTRSLVEMRVLLARVLGHNPDLMTR